MKLSSLAGSSLAFVTGVAVALVGYGLETNRAEVAPHLTRRGLLQVTPGMLARDVPNRIGYPIDVKIHGSQSMDPLVHSVDWPGPYVWIYARPGWLPGLEASVTLVDGVVSRVDVEYDNRFVYSTDTPAPVGAPALSKVLD